MIWNVYTIYDSAAKAFGRPFFFQADGQAIRTFTDMREDKESDIGKHPEDYSLLRVGRWDDQTATLHAEQPTKLGSPTTELKEVK